MLDSLRDHPPLHRRVRASLMAALLAACSASGTKSDAQGGMDEDAEAGPTTGQVSDGGGMDGGGIDAPTSTEDAGTDGDMTDAVSDTGATHGDAAAAACTPGIGLSTPTPPCTVDAPCTDLLPTYALLEPKVTVLDTPSDEPLCGTSTRGLDQGRPAYDDGPARQWVDGDGVPRYWCEARPSGTGASSPRPLVIWVTGSGGHAGSVYDTTSLRGKQDSFDLSGDPARPGFVLVSVQPRNLHWPTLDAQDGTKSETYFRDLGVPSTNPDVAFVDHLVDTLADEGVIDESRIYLMGWSNGARFTATYAIGRHERATTGGRRIAAVANYSGGNPFVSFDLSRPECALEPVPRSAVPFLLISRTCDAVACDADTDWGVVPGNVAEPWVRVLRDDVGADVRWIRIDARGIERQACALPSLCNQLSAVASHLRWPDGVADTGDQDHEPTLLRFLAEHPLGG